MNRVGIQVIPYLTLPYRMACLLTLSVTGLHHFLFCSILLHCSKFKPAHCRMLSLHCSRSLPLPRLPSTMPSSRLRCKLSCLIMCPKKESFLCFTVWKSDLLVSASLSTSSLVTCLVQLILSNLLNAHISNASSRCCEVLLMVQVSTPYSKFDQT